MEKNGYLITDCIESCDSDGNLILHFDTLYLDILYKASSGQEHEGLSLK